MKSDWSEGGFDEDVKRPVLVFNRKRFIKVALWICLLLFLSGVIIGAKIVGG